MVNEFHQQLHELEHGPPFAFRDWPATHFDQGPSGVYTVWKDDVFLYVGMAWAHRDDANPRALGVFGRLRSHASGRRSGDQFAIYVCDRFVIPDLDPPQLDSLRRGERILDPLTRQFIHDHLVYRVVVTDNGATARALEAVIRREGLPHAGRPQINP